MKTPSDCTSMEELRFVIDALDRRLIALFKQRQDCIDRAAELKPDEGLPARIDSRVAEVIANVRAASVAQGVDPNLMASLWKQLIDWSIEREEVTLGPKDAGPTSKETKETKEKTSE